MKTKIIALTILAILLQACATPHVVNVEEATDRQLSCSQLQGEMNTARKFEQSARKKRGVTGRNVAAFIFFPIGLLATYANSDEAIDAARDRRQHLMAIYRQKGCDKGTLIQPLY